MILDLIDRIYEASLDRSRWWLALARLGEVLRCSKTALLREAEGKWTVLAASDSSATREEERTLAAVPLGSSAIPLAPRDRISLLVDRETLGDVEAEILRQLSVHLARAWRITERVADADARERYGSSAFDRLPFGVILLTGEGQISQLNEEARRLLRAQRDLRVVGGALRGTTAGAQEAFASACARLREATTEGRSGPTQELDLRAAAGGVEIEIALVPAPTARVAEEDPELVAFLRESTRTDLAPAAMLARRFRLDDTEERILDEVLHGQPVVHRWRDLQMTQRDVQDRLRRLYEKLGSTRQRDLVQLLLSLPDSETAAPWEGASPSAR